MVLAGWITRLREALKRHHRVLWWMHSVYALFFGIAFMWLGAKNFNYLRVAIFHLAFIWLTSLFLPILLKNPKLSPIWAGRIRFFINYFSKNFFQQVVFFVLPIYHHSATYFSRNTLFMMVLVVSAILSTLDVVYDDYISANWHYMALFLAFNMFACFNVMLPVLWKIGNTATILLSGLLATVAFCSLCLRHSGFQGRRRLYTAGAAAGLMALLVLAGRPLVPPAPLELIGAQFGMGISRRQLAVTRPLDTVPAGLDGSLYALTSIRAPMGLSEKVQHVWYRDGDKVLATRLVTLEGGRKDGYRYWSQLLVKELKPDAKIQLEVRTEGGQLIGRATIRAAE